MEDFFKNKLYLKDNGKINNSKIKKTFIKKNYPYLYLKINNYSKINNFSNIEFTRQIWHYYYKLNIPLCNNCNVNETKWTGFLKGYRSFCSNKCSSNSKITKDKIKTTNIKKYGTDNPMQNIKVKNKRTNTVIDKYGVDNVMKSNKIKDLYKKTCIDKYGVDNVFGADIIKEKSKKSLINNYGVDNPGKSDIIKNKIKKTNLIKYKKESHLQNCEVIKKRKNTNNLVRKEKFISLGINNENIIKINKDYIEIKCDKCLNIFKENIFFIYQRLKVYNVNPCTKCNPINYSSSRSECELLQFIKDNYLGTIIENDRKILSGKELDIYLPDLGLAFEFNGVYWHNELFKENNYHLYKTEDCLNKNIQLIHIYEDDWNYKQEIVKSRILNSLSKSKRIYARKCIIKEVNSKEVRSFLEDNHIQGFVGSKVKLGLYYKVPGTETDELVSLMTFGSLRKNLGQVSKKGSYELLRFCNLLNTTVVGGASRLFKYFKLKYSPKEIISYADRSWSKGGLYENLGFEFIKNTVPNYQYVIGDIRKNRFGYRKDILIKEGYDSNMTEHNIMISRDIYRIYDSGSIKYSFKL